MVERGRLRQFCIRHAGIDAADLHVFQEHHEIHLLLSRIVNAMPIDLGRLQRLSRRYGLIKIRRCNIKFHFERDCRVSTRAGDLAVGRANWQIHCVRKANKLDAAFTILS